MSYSTFLGGSYGDQPAGIVVDSSRSAYITGQTSSADFPVTSGSKHNNSDVFVTKLSPDGSSLIYSTFIGGSGSDWGSGIGMDLSGNAYVTGTTYSSDFPASGYKGSTDAFVLKLTPAGTLANAILLGGTSSDYGITITVNGSVYVGGYTYSSGMATAGAYQASLGGSQDGFVSKLSTNLVLQYTTYLGGSQYDSIAGITADSSGNAYVTGSTSSTNFPTTTNALTKIAPGGGDAFVTVLNGTGTQLLYSGYLGGSGNDSGTAIALDSSGNVYIAGTTSSNDFPTQAGSFATTRPNSYSYCGFVSKFNLSGSGQVWSPGYSSYLGGSDGNSTSVVS